MTPDDERHGTAAGYAAGCHELCCRSAHTRLQKRRRHDRLHGRGWRQPAIGTQRRIQALYALGWRSKDIAPLIGVGTGEGVHNLMTRKYVSKSARDRIAAAYDTLSMSIGPSELNRKRAAAKGWAVPLRWDDEALDDPNGQPHKPRTKGANPELHEIDPVIVDRAMNGERVKANVAERAEVVRRWITAGRSRNALEAAQGWNTTRDNRKSAA